MNQDEIERELTAASDLLENTTLGRLAYNGPDGRPRVVPIGFFWTGSTIVMCTAPSAPKVKALQERPEVAFVVDSGNTPEGAKSLSVRGTVTIDIVDGVAEEYLAAAYRAYDAEQAAEFEMQVRALYREQARIVIEPTWARFFDFGAGRMPKFLIDLAASM